MSTKLLLFTFALSLLSMPSRATTIGFNEEGLVPGAPGTSLTNQLAAQGLLFSSSGTDNYVSNTNFPNGNVVTEGNFLVVLNKVILASQPWGFVTITFQGGGASNISFDVFDGNGTPSPRVLIRAFDDEDIQLGDALGLTTLKATLSIPFARYIQLEDTGADGFVIDNLSFNLIPTDQGVPEPGTYLLFGGGLAILGLLKVRRNVQR